LRKGIDILDMIVPDCDIVPASFVKQASVRGVSP
jgi:hypothetical protein